MAIIALVVIKRLNLFVWRDVNLKNFKNIKSKSLEVRVGPHQTCVKSKYFYQPWFFRRPACCTTQDSSTHSTPSGSVINIFLCTLIRVSTDLFRQKASFISCNSHHYFLSSVVKSKLNSHVLFRRNLHNSYVIIKLKPHHCYIMIIDIAAQKDAWPD